jgi:CheY-like chemotaxis protein
MIASMLQARGATVAAAESADEALAVLRAADADLFISDIGMPRVDGYELMRRIRAADGSALRAVPAIALTAFARAEDAARARAAGYDLHLAKPVEPARLFAAVGALLAEKRKAAKAG